MDSIGQPSLINYDLSIVLLVLLLIISLYHTLNGDEHR